ncbi:MAG: cyclic pyranopterin monophosphate synthase MoaC [Candidatus Velthaea sp.]
MPKFIRTVSKPSHIAADGSLIMVDIGEKAVTSRMARGEARVRMAAPTAAALREATLAKGDAFVAAQLAGILAAKQTGTLIPLAHPLPLSAVEVSFEWADERTLRIEARATTTGRTGVEMEALVAASVAALTIYDMCKALEKGIVIEGVRLLEKTGGKSGEWRAETPV